MTTTTDRVKALLANAADGMDIPVRLSVGFIEAEIGTVKGGSNTMLAVAELLEAAAAVMREENA